MEPELADVGPPWVSPGGPAGGVAPGSARYTDDVPASELSRIWVQMTDEELEVGEAAAWVAAPSCGAIALFCGTVRDHSDGRPGVLQLEYEAFAEQVEPRLAAVAEAALERWPGIGRVVLLHRVGTLVVGEISVVVAVSTPHRAEAFDSARFCIETLKASVPIWKREVWEGGADWGLCAHDLIDLPGGS